MPSSVTSEANPVYDREAHNPFVNMGTMGRRTTIAGGLGLQHPAAPIIRAETPRSKLSVKRASVSPSLGLPEPLLTPPRSTNRKSTASSGARTRASTSVKKEEATAGQRGQPSASVERESIAVPNIKRKQVARSTTVAQVDDPFALMGNDFAGMDASRFVKGTLANTFANEVATGKSKNEAIYVISDSESDEEIIDCSIVENAPQETPTKPRQALRSGSGPVKQAPVPPVSLIARAAQQASSSSRVIKTPSPFARGSAPLTPPQNEKKPAVNANTSQHSNPWTGPTSSGLPTPAQTPARRGKEMSRGAKGKGREEEIVLPPSPSPSTPTSRIRRTAQQLATPQTPTRVSANSPTFGPARPPANANRQSPPKAFLPTSIVGIPGLNYTLDEYETVYNRKTGGRQYKLPSDDLLKEYQTTDVDLAMTAFMYRYCLRVEKGKGNPVQHDPDELVQGILLNYEMGLGKTHVASVLIDRGKVHREKANETLDVPNLPLKPDLVIAPLSTHKHWEEHLTKLSEGRLKVKIWGTGRKPLDPEVDVYIITINAFRNHHHRFGEYQDWFDERHEANPAENPKRDWSLGLTAVDKAWARAEAPFAITEFNTVVVDESHEVRNSGTLGGRALLSVHTDNFLLLTGTPAQNTLDDMQIIFALMVHRSKRNDFREQEKLNRKLNKDRKEANPKARSLPMHVDEVLGTVFNGDKEIQHFMNSCMVTRKKKCPEKGTVLVELPKLHRVRVEVLQSAQEKKLSRYVADLTASDIRLVRVLRQRQVVLHGNLVRKVILDKTSPRPADEDTMDEDITDNFNVLSSDLKFLKVDPGAELRRAIEAGLDKRELPPELKGMSLDQLLEPKYIPSKFKAIYAIIEKVPKGEKVIIFSLFTSLLDVLGNFLGDNEIEFTQLDGRMNSRQREKALRTIADDHDVKVMLVSTKAGGVGLNITSCNHVILFDPWWNPYVEEQAISRAHRIGQTRECYVYRLHSPDTVEDEIVQVAKAKRGPIEAFMARCAVLTNERDAAQRARFEA